MWFIGCFHMSFGVSRLLASCLRKVSTLGRLRDGEMAGPNPELNLGVYLL